MSLPSFDPPYGFALQVNASSCPSSAKVECGPSWGGFRSCCPGGTVCPGKIKPIKNNVCCPFESDCTQPIEARPHCADKSWTLYDRGGGFCCPPGELGFYNENDFVGCAVEVNNRRYTLLTPIAGKQKQYLAKCSYQRGTDNCSANNAIQLCKNLINNHCIIKHCVGDINE